MYFYFVSEEQFSDKLQRSAKIKDAFELFVISRK